MGRGPPLQAQGPRVQESRRSQEGQADPPESRPGSRNPLLFKELTLLFVKAWLVRPATVYREALPSLTRSDGVLGACGSRLEPRMYMAALSPV